MQAPNFPQLMLRLLPRGDCWNFERDSFFYKVIQGLSLEFERIHSLLIQITEASYPKTPTSVWKDSLLFQPFPGGLYTLSQASIQAQMDYFKMEHVDFVAPIEEPFVLYLHIKADHEKFFSAGDEVGNELCHWRDEKLETLLSEIIPAFSKLNFIYRSENA